MPRTAYTLSLPPDWGEGLKQVWNMLADEVVDRPGQRGQNASKLFVLICSAAMTDYGETVRRLNEIKNIKSPA